MSQKQRWVMCARCKDVHHDGARVMRQFGKWRGLCFSHCPKCNSSVMAPMASVPLQRNIFEYAHE